MKLSFQTTLILAALSGSNSSLLSTNNKIHRVMLEPKPSSLKNGEVKESLRKAEQLDSERHRLLEQTM
jgi:hypothetical protein